MRNYYSGLSVSIVQKYDNFIKFAYASNQIKPGASDRTTIRAYPNIKHKMIKTGKYNELRVSRFTDFGAYLTDDDARKPTEILMPAKYVDEDLVVGDTVKAFVYLDSEDRLVATTEVPFAQVGEFAFLQAVQVNRIGAFLDWGLTKNVLCPFSEQRIKMHEGGIYLVYIYVDDETKRIVASAKIDKFLGNVFPEYRQGQKVEALAYAHTEIGYKVIVDNMHKGMIYDNETFAPVELESTFTAYVKAVRPDGKIDLTLTMPGTQGRVTRIGDRIMEMLEKGDFNLTDNSSPEDIKETLHCSKKDFKKAIGALYKDRKITISPAGVINPA